MQTVANELQDPYAKTKAHAHFYKRALERHGLILRSIDLARIIHQITSGNAEFLRWSGEPDQYRSFYRVRIYDQPYIVLYDLAIDSLVTIYHNSWLVWRNDQWVRRDKWKRSRNDNKMR